MMRRICLIIEYDGTDFAGWQRQKGQNSVQEEIEKNLKIITGQDIVLHGSGRTDSGVHALAQVAHFDTDVRMPVDKFVPALNTGLPLSIRVHKSFEVDESFHARFSAKKKHYRYTIENTKIASALHRNFRLHVYGKLDEKKMNDAAKMLLGRHDFASFTSAGCHVKNTIREIYTSEITREGDIIYYDVIGNGFLFNMVRIIVGTLIEIGRGKRDASDIEIFLNEANRYLRVGATARAHGLTLVSVDYDRVSSPKGEYLP